MTAPRRRLGALAATFALAAAACGIPLDSEPRSAPSTEATDTRTADATEGASRAFVWFVRGNELIPVQRDVQERSAGELVNALLAGPSPGDTSRGLTSQIPPGTKATGVTQEAGGLAIVSLSGEFANVVGTGLTQAISQMVLTLTSLPDIERVGFVVAGSSIQAYSPASRGDLALVGECDYQSFLPPDPTAITGLTANSLSHLSARLSRLERLCFPTADEEAPQVSGQSQRR